jgi:8-oxo-dGTP diphosphatase
MRSTAAEAGLVHVVAAAICDHRGRVLIARRPDHVHQGGKWEFPGGKVEPGETARAALRRELSEELGIRPRRLTPLISIRHAYPEKRVLLDVWRVGDYSGVPGGREGQAIRWVGLEELGRFDFPAANRPALKALTLPDRYLITPEPGGDWARFLATLEQALWRGIELVQLRAKALAPERYLALAGRVRVLCRDHGARLILNGEPQWVRLVGADGVQLSGARLMGLQTRPLPGACLVGASCHDRRQLAHAQDIGVDFAVLSPVRPTRSHPGAPALGWGRFRGLCEDAGIPVYALGGMGDGDLRRSKWHGGQGIAAIRALWPGLGACRI